MKEGWGGVGGKVVYLRGVEVLITTMLSHSSACCTLRCAAVNFVLMDQY